MQQNINFVLFQNFVHSRNICTIQKFSKVTRMLVGRSLSCFDTKSIIHPVWWIYGFCNVYYKKILQDFLQSSRFFCNVHCKCTCTTILFPSSQPSIVTSMWDSLSRSVRTSPWDTINCLAWKEVGTHLKDILKMKNNHKKFIPDDKILLLDSLSQSLDSIDNGAATANPHNFSVISDMIVDSSCSSLIFSCLNSANNWCSTSQ